MAINKTNLLLKGISGNMGKLIVFRQRNGVTILSAHPTKNKKYKATKKQKERQAIFSEANSYAQQVIKDPQQKAAYLQKAKGNQSAYNVAIRDYLTAPVVHMIDYSDYKGHPSDLIRLQITDILAVVQVKIGLYSSNGRLIEEGEAEQMTLPQDWKYTTTAENNSVAGTKIVVQMTSTPGNKYEKEMVIEE